MSPRTDSDRSASVVPGRCSPTELRGHSIRRLGSAPRSRLGRTRAWMVSPGVTPPLTEVAPRPGPEFTARRRDSGGDHCQWAFAGEARFGRASQRSKGVRAAGLPHSPFKSLQPDSDGQPCRYKRPALPVAPWRHGVPGATRTLTAGVLSAVTPAIGLRAPRASSPNRTDDLRVTKALLCH